MARLEKRQQKAQRKQERKLGIRSDSNQEDENAGLGLENEGDNADHADNAGIPPDLG